MAKASKKKHRPKKPDTAIGDYRQNMKPAKPKRNSKGGK